MIKSKNKTGKVIYKNGLGTLFQWEYPLFLSFVIVLFLGLGYLFLTFNPEAVNPDYYPSWMKYWLAFALFLLFFDLLMLFQVLFVYPYKLIKYDDKYRLNYYEDGENKEIVIQEFYYWWSYGWSVMETPESGGNMDLWEWLSSPAEKRRYKRQTILFVGMIDPDGKQVLFFQVVGPFENVPDGWKFRKGTKMLKGRKALKLQGFVDAVRLLKKG